MVYIESSVISGIDYDKEAETLLVEFNSGAEYVYAGVPEEEFVALVEADSKGEYFNNHISDEYDCDEAGAAARNAIDAD